MKYIIIDLEMNLLADEYVEEKQICKQEIIEIGAVCLDERLESCREFKVLVCPEYNSEIHKKVEKLTGITTGMVIGAPRFSSAIEVFASWCESYEDDYEIYAWSENDLKQIQDEMLLKRYSSPSVDRLIHRWNDFQEEYRVKLGLERIMTLEKALNYAGVPFVGRQHDALDDAKNTAELFAIVRDEDRCQETLKYVLDALKPKKISGTLGDMFDFSKLMAACC